MKKNQQDSRLSNLKIIFKYYCNLQVHQLKHKNFDEFQKKTQFMSKHQFMVFCKNFQIIQHREQKIIKKSLNVPDKENLFQENQSDGEKNSAQQIPELIEGDGEEEKPQNIIKEQKTSIKPKRLIRQQKLMKYFNKFSSSEGQLTFELFVDVLKLISRSLYQENTKKENDKQTKEKKMNLSLSMQGGNDEDFFQLFIKFLKVDTKYNLINTFKKVNEIHNDLKYLSIIREPVPSSQIKLYTLKQSRAKNTNQKKDLVKTAKENRQNQSNSVKTVSRFIQKNQNKIKGLNEGYLQNALKANKINNQHILMVTNKMSKEDNLEMSRVLAKTKYNQVDEKFLKSEVKKNQDNLKQIIKQNKKSYQQEELEGIVDMNDFYQDPVLNEFIVMNYQSKVQSPSLCN